MNTQPSISDAKTVNTKDLLKASDLSVWSIWNHERLGNLTKGERRPGTRGRWWTPRQANLFLRRIGKPQVFGSDEK
jgi:hypothetical protein